MGSDLAKAIIGGAVGILSTLITLLITSLRERSSQQVREKYSDSLKKEIEIWKAWIEAQSQVCDAGQMPSVKDRAKRALDSLAEGFELAKSSGNLEFRLPSKRVEPPGWISRVLLLYPAGRPQAWIPRIFFYSALLYLAALVGAYVLQRVGSGDRAPGDTVAVLVTISTVLLLAFVFRWLGIQLDRISKT